MLSFNCSAALYWKITIVPCPISFQHFRDRRFRQCQARFAANIKIEALQDGAEMLETYGTGHLLDCC
jgi:hypothetical protein